MNKSKYFTSVKRWESSAMTCVVLTAVALATFPGESRAEPTKVHLAVRPMSAPKPALKYQLLPEVSERNPGNAAFIVSTPPVCMPRF